MDEQHQQTDKTPPTGDESTPAFLHTVTGRLAAVLMVVLIIVGTVALVVLLRDRNDASANQNPSEELLDLDLAVTGAEVVRVDPPAVSGICPVEMTFTADINTTGGEGTILYRWFFDDAGATEPEEIFLPVGVTNASVELHKIMGGSDGKYANLSEQVSIQILEQNGEEVSITSSKHSFSIACSS